MPKLIPQTIALDLAFRWVVACFELADGVAANQRLGLAPGELVPAGGPPSIPATGPAYVRKTAPLVITRRGREPTPPRTPDLQPVPDGYRLRILLEDHENPLVTASMAEQRHCRAHCWIIAALRENRITAWADQYVRPPGSEGSADDVWIGRVAVPPATWAECDIDYAAATAVSRGDDWKGVADDGYRHRGNLVLGRIAIDRAALEIALLAIGAGGSAIAAELRMVTAENPEVWVLNWNGTDCRIEVAGSTLLSRGLRAISVLLRLPKVRVSHYLLDGLARRPGHTRQKDAKIKEKRDRIHAAIDPLGQRVFGRSTDVVDAHALLAAELIRLRVEDHNYLKAASWSAQFVPATSKGPRKLSLEGKRVGENVRKSVNAAIEAIRGSNPDAGKDAATFLRKGRRHISPACHGFRQLFVFL